MARDLRLNIDADAAAARANLGATAKAVDHLADETDRLEKQFAQASREAAKLDRKLLETRAAAAALSKEFARTGDEALVTQLRDHERAATQIKRIQKNIVGDSERRAKEAAAAWKRAFNALGDVGGHGSGFSGIPGRLFGALGESSVPVLSTLAKHPALAAAATPAIAGTAILAGATAGGAVTAGIGAGVAGAGIAGAAMQSKAVQGEWSRAIAAIKAEFLDATSGFVGPTLAAIDKVRGAFAAVDMKAIFGNAQQFVQPLADGIAKAVKFFGQGAESLTSKAMPAIVALSNGIADLGNAVKVAMEQIGDGSDGGAKALDDVFTAISDLIILTGTWIGWFEDAYGAIKRVTEGLREMHPFIGAVADKIDEVTGNKTVSQLSGPLQSANDATKEWVSSLRAAAQESGSLADNLDRVFNVMNDAITADLDFRESLDELTKSLREHKGQWDADTQAGRDHIRATQEAIEKAYAKMQADIAAGKSAAAARDEFKAATDAILKQADAAGADEATLRNLTAAWKAFLDTPSTKDLTVRIHQVGTVSAQGVISGGDQRTRVGKAYASGTMSATPGLALVHKNELIDFRGGERVYNSRDTARILRGMALPSTGGLVDLARRSRADSANVKVTLRVLGTDSALGSLLMKMQQNGQLAFTATAA